MATFGWVVESYPATIIRDCFFPVFDSFFRIFGRALLFFCFPVPDPDPAVLDPNPAVSECLPGKILLPRYLGVAGTASGNPSFAALGEKESNAGN